MSMTKIKTEMFKRHGSDVYCAALQADKARAEQLVEAYQDSWDNGDKFAGGVAYLMFAGMFGESTQRDADTPEELAACAHQLHNDLSNIVINDWIAKLSRDQVVAIRDILERSSPSAAIVICNGIDRLDIDDITLRWNKTHAGEMPVYKSDPDIG